MEMSQGSTAIFPRSCPLAKMLSMACRCPNPLLVLPAKVEPAGRTSEAVRQTIVFVIFLGAVGRNQPAPPRASGDNSLPIRGHTPNGRVFGITLVGGKGEGVASRHGVRLERRVRQRLIANIKEGVLKKRRGSRALPSRWGARGATRAQTKRGGGLGIRTPDAREGMPVFKTGAINHSANPPKNCRRRGRDQKRPVPGPDGGSPRLRRTGGEGGI